MPDYRGGGLNPALALNLNAPAAGQTDDDDLRDRLEHIAWDIRPSDLDLNRIVTIVNYVATGETHYDNLIYRRVLNEGDLPDPGDPA